MNIANVSVVLSLFRSFYVNIKICIKSRNFFLFLFQATRFGGFRGWKVKSIDKANSKFSYHLISLKREFIYPIMAKINLQKVHFKRVTILYRLFFLKTVTQHIYKINFAVLKTNCVNEHYFKFSSDVSPTACNINQ